MMACFWFRLDGRVCRLFSALMLVTGVALAASPAAAADIDVVLDQAKIVKLPERVATVIIGNPLIADASLHSGGQMIVTGKGYGMTNVMALDRAGTVLMDKTVEVIGPPGIVIVYRGTDRESYSCAPDCERRITLGDSPAYFEATSHQTSARNGLAVGTAPAPR
jgi:Flp pilus assembly secretin CpaC